MLSTDLLNAWMKYGRIINNNTQMLIFIYVIDNWMFINIVIDSDRDIFYIRRDHCSIVPQITIVINIVIVTLVYMNSLKYA